MSITKLTLLSVVLCCGSWVLAQSSPSGGSAPADGSGTSGQSSTPGAATAPAGTATAPGSTATPPAGSTNPQATPGTPSNPGTTPNGSTQGSNPAGSTSPSSTSPNGTTPGTTTPNNTNPGTTSPSSSTPGSTTPGSSAPNSSTPGAATPGSTTPGAPGQPSNPNSNTPPPPPGSTIPPQRWAQDRVAEVGRVLRRRAVPSPAFAICVWTFSGAHRVRWTVSTPWCRFCRDADRRATPLAANLAECWEDTFDAARQKPWRTIDCRLPLRKLSASEKYARGTALSKIPDAGSGWSAAIANSGPHRSAWQSRRACQRAGSRSRYTGTNVVIARSREAITAIRRLPG